MLHDRNAHDVNLDRGIVGARLLSLLELHFSTIINDLRDRIADRKAHGWPLQITTRI